MSWLDGAAIVFEVLGLLAFVVSIGFWIANFIRAKRAGILDYSMFSMHPLFLLCTLFTGIMLLSAMRYYHAENTVGFRTSFGAAVLFLSVLEWNPGFVTKKGLYLTGTPLNPLSAKQENGFLLFTPERRDIRATKPIIYENTPENREKFADLLHPDPDETL